MAVTTTRRTANISGEGLLLLLVCLAPSVLVGLAGLHRPYDAIPDQDMLWASEALRLLRGVAPSYADHPGIFWTLTYTVNSRILENLLGPLAFRVALGGLELDLVAVQADDSDETIPLLVDLVLEKSHGAWDGIGG